MTTIEFRPLEEQDFESLSSMAHAAWTFAYEGVLDPDWMRVEVAKHYGPQRLAELLPGVRAGRSFFDVAVAEGRVLGLCCAGTAPTGVELYRLYLDPSALGQGIAKTLLARLERYVRAQGAGVYYCHVHKDNERGKRFYLKHGFIHLAREDTAEDWRMAKIVRTGMAGFLTRLRVRLQSGRG